MKKLIYFTAAAGALMIAGFLLSEPGIKASAAEFQFARGDYVASLDSCLDQLRQDETFGCLPFH